MYLITMSASLGKGRSRVVFRDAPQAVLLVPVSGTAQMVSRKQGTFLRVRTLGCTPGARAQWPWPG